MPTTTAGRRNKRLLQGERSRDEILDAASRMMSIRGFDGTSIADIARESGLPNSSIYWHFKSKLGILAAVMERGADRFFASVTTPEPDPGDTPEVYMRRALGAASAAFVDHPEFLRLFVLLLLSSDTPETTEIIERVRAHGRSNLHALITHAFTTIAPEQAEQVADGTVDFALAGFDGAFLALQANPAAAHEHLMEQLASALSSLGREALRV
ncbi:TetR/AcrR family transcriptional regulator [Streptomyces sp. NPDC002896]|uniref:TetR/AcrR family transcriptional regulator n=1 Tax=Streptomyces sp. NPDC002896 TaxID=3154438 RepID=UPI00333148C1